MSFPSVIIVGTGRSGTSHAAQMCAEMGICMGHNMKPDAKAPRAHHEDYLAHSLTIMIHAGMIGADEWLSLMEQSHDGCERWGAKDPWFLTWTEKGLKTIAPRLIIRAWRPLEDCLDSWRRIRALCGEVETEEDKAYVHKLFTDRERWGQELQESGEFNMMTINYETRLSDDDVKTMIEKGLAA